MIEKFFDNSSVRRQDRLLDIERAEQILATAEWGVLSLVDESGEAYGIPINYVWDGESSIYIHCAKEGKKIRAINKNSKVCLSVVGSCDVIPQKYTAHYQSVIVYGKASVGLDDKQKYDALMMLLRKFAPEDSYNGQKFSEQSFARTEVIKIEITQITAKSKPGK